MFGWLIPEPNPGNFLDANGRGQKIACESNFKDNEFALHFLRAGRLFSNRAVTAHFSCPMPFPGVIWPGMLLSNGTDWNRAETYPGCRKRYQVDFSLTIDNATRWIVWDSRQKKLVTIGRVTAAGWIWNGDDCRCYQRTSRKKVEKYFECQIRIPFLTLREALILGICRDHFPAKLTVRGVPYIWHGCLLLHLQSASSGGPFIWF